MIIQAMFSTLLLMAKCHLVLIKQLLMQKKQANLVGSCHCLRARSSFVLCPD